MTKLRLLNSIEWPTDVIYNITSEDGAKCKGSADVEHCVADGNPIWGKMGEWVLFKFPINDSKSNEQCVPMIPRKQLELPIPKIAT